MPLSEEQKALAFATLIPGAAGLVGGLCYKNDPGIVDWFQSLKKPDWVIEKSDNFMLKNGLLNILIMAPSAYATYQVFMKGTDLPEVRCALAANAALWGSACVFTPIFYKRNLKTITCGLGVMFGIGLCATHKYHQVDKHAGYLTLPGLAGCLYGVLAYYRMWCMNEEEKKE